MKIMCVASEHQCLMRLHSLLNSADFIHVLVSNPKTAEQELCRAERERSPYDVLIIIFHNDNQKKLNNLLKSAKKTSKDLFTVSIIEEDYVESPEDEFASFSDLILDNCETTENNLLDMLKVML